MKMSYSNRFRIGIIINVLAILLSSCALTVRTTTTTNYKPNTSNAPIIVYGLNDRTPNQTQRIGTIKIGDSGFSVNCGWDQVLQKAKSECKKIGGNAIKLEYVKEPDFSSTCYRINAAALIVPEQKFIDKSKKETGLTEEILKNEWSKTGVDAIEGIYEKVIGIQSAKYNLALKKISNTEYYLIYLSGALSQYTLLWNEGDLKAKLYKTATENFYKVKWYMANKSIEEDIYITFEKGLMKTIWTENGNEELYLKLYPISESSIVSKNPEVLSSGTGFAISKNGYIVTNQHVIENASEIIIKGVGTNFDSEYDAKVVFRDKNNDIAILKLVDEKFSEIEGIPYTIKTELASVGESVFGLGYPLRATMGDEIKLTNGIISSKTGFQGDITNYQISVPVQPGNSGGPLFDNKGNIIGIISAKHIGAENASYAVKISYLENLLELSDESISLPIENSLTNKTLPEQVELIKKFVYIIECK
jgi:S1-C subfamily serine protease